MIKFREIDLPTDIIQRAKIATRLLSHVTRKGNCLIWNGHINKKGYGMMSLNHQAFLVHRISYELFKGSIPKGLTVDHLCKNKACQNVDHMEAISNKDNILRGNNTAARNSRKTHCIRGHEFTPENIYKQHGNMRMCRECTRISHHNSYLKRKQKNSNVN